MWCGQDFPECVQKLAPGLSAVGTFCAVAVALWLAGRQRRLEAKRRARDQAEHVTAWLQGRTDENGGEGRITVPVRIHNASEQVVYDLVAQIVRVPQRAVRGALPTAKAFNHEYGACVGNVPPGGIEMKMGHPGHSMHARYGIELAFQDAAGRYWLRSANGILEEVNKHPIELYGMELPISWAHEWK